MTTVHLPKTWSDGDKPDWKEYGEEIFDTLEFLMNPPMCWVKASGPTSIVNGTFTAITMGTVITDMPGTQAMFNPAQPTRVTPKTQGFYVVLYGASWDNVACGCTGRRVANVRVNGTLGANRMDERPGSATVAHKIAEGLTNYVYFNGTTDYVELVQFTDGGTVNNGNSTDGWQSSIYVRWVSRF